MAELNSIVGELLGLFVTIGLAYDNIIKSSQNLYTQIASAQRLPNKFGEPLD